MHNDSLIIVIDWAPTIDVSENEREWSAVAKLPDVIKDDLKVTIDNGVLTLMGKRTVPKKPGRNPNFAYGNFARIIHLPTYVDCCRGSAQLENEVLTIHLPMLEKQKLIIIPIHLHASRPWSERGTTCNS